MTVSTPGDGRVDGSAAKPGRSRIRRWIRVAFIVWGIGSTTYVVGAFRTRGVDPALLRSDGTVTVGRLRDTLGFLPIANERSSGLVLIVGAGVAPEAYAPLLRPIAERGHPVYVVGLPFRIAPLESHRMTAVGRAKFAMFDHKSVTRWVVAGHSLGGALAARLAANPTPGMAEVVLIGTTHPKAVDLSRSTLPMTKVIGTHDGVADIASVEATRSLLPRDTRWIEIAGGNHSQFAHYGHQLFDGTATISREEQQDRTRAALLEALARAQ
jgi:pimeloyl-ACP methyl ester carboxylesterase